MAKRKMTPTPADNIAKQIMEAYHPQDAQDIQDVVKRIFAPIFEAVGHVLAGAAIGIRGTIHDISYDVFVAAPIEKPKGFHTPDATCGFSLGWRF